MLKMVFVLVVLFLAGCLGDYKHLTYKEAHQDLLKELPFTITSIKINQDSLFIFGRHLEIIDTIFMGSTGQISRPMDLNFYNLDSSSHEKRLREKLGKNFPSLQVLQNLKKQGNFYVLELIRSKSFQWNRSQTELEIDAPSGNRLFSLSWEPQGNGGPYKVTLTSRK